MSIRFIRLAIAGALAMFLMPAFAESVKKIPGDKTTAQPGALKLFEDLAEVHEGSKGRTPAKTQKIPKKQ
jgi:hypothetical protein